MEYSVQKIVNPTLAYEGAGTPPKAAEGFRVPAVDGLQIVKNIPVLGGAKITLTFNEESTPNKCLYYVMAYTGQDLFSWAGQNVKDMSINKLQNIQGPFICFGSPATIYVQAEQELAAFITVTTRTPGGIVSELLAQPGVSTMVSPLSVSSFMSTNSYTPQEPSSGSKALTSTGQTTVVNVTEEGIVHFVVVETTTGMGGIGATAKLKFTIDGGTASNLTVINGALFEDWVRACPGSGDGSTNNDRREIPLGFTYVTSLKMEIDCTAGAFGSGTLKATLVRSKKV